MSHVVADLLAIGQRSAEAYSRDEDEHIRSTTIRDDETEAFVLSEKLYSLKTATDRLASEIGISVSHVLAANGNFFGNIICSRSPASNDDLESDGTSSSDKVQRILAGQR